MNERTKNRLDRHRENYKEITGNPFRHFFCPILFEDVEGDLIRGHVINESFKGSSKAWVVQRGEVDRFYGGFFEGDFELLQYMHKSSMYDYFANPKLFGYARPQIYFRGERVKYFLHPGKSLPTGFVPLDFEFDGKRIWLALRATHEMMLEGDDSWDIQTKYDLRIPAFVSLIKAAHLTMFSLFGYRYVFSYSGRFIGQDILGRFYRENRTIKTKKEAQRAAFHFFRKYIHMVRPIMDGTTDMSGTLTDGIVHLCQSTTDTPWGMVVFLKTGPLHHAALIPNEEGPDAFATFLDFLSNDRDQIHVSRGAYEPQNRRWLFEPNPVLVKWPKDGMLYPQSFDK